ncbi:MAG: DNA-protecting protein DprA [Ruminococcaceae bacterium]|nr:DNA-protecting protein DprA [Oscillospiraceae bacterium]
MLLHWLWLATKNGMSDRKKMAILQCFGDPEDVFYAESYERIDGLTVDELALLQDKSITDAKRILAQCTDQDIHLLTYSDKEYPTRLKYIADPPLVLYYKGRLPDFNDAPVIGVVGTRDASPYGCSAARRMGYQLVKGGGLLVSGCAKGIDTMAMKGALEADGTPVGVLGCGVDVVYPASNRWLFAELERRGCLISEYPPETPPAKWNFPKRNRIISGMSCGVLVVEAPMRSGALITARQAAEQGRDVFVVPGNIDVETCAGSNAMLRDGAMAVSTGWDILSEYQAQYPGKLGEIHEVPEDSEPEKTVLLVAQKPVVPRRTGLLGKIKSKKIIDKKGSGPYSDVEKRLPPLTEEEQVIVNQLKQGQRLTDEVIAGCGLPSGRVLSVLTMLQVKGVIERLPGNRLALK